MIPHNCLLDYFESLWVLNVICLHLLQCLLLIVSKLNDFDKAFVVRELVRFDYSGVEEALIIFLLRNAFATANWTEAHASFALMFSQTVETIGVRARSHYFRYGCFLIVALVAQLALHCFLFITSLQFS